MKNFKTPKERKLYQLGIRFWFFVMAFSLGRVVCAQTCTLPANAGTIVGASTVCQRQNLVSYTVPPIAGATSYIWTLPTGATGSSVTNIITVNYSATAISGDISVKGINLCGEGESASLPITVNQLPMADFEFSPDKQCSPMTVTFNNTTTGSSSFTSVWDFEDTKTSTLKHPSNTFSAAAGNGDQSFNVKLTVNDGANCSNSLSKSVVVKQAPDATMNGTGSGSVFNGTPVFRICSNIVSTFTFTNGSTTKATNANYKIHWGDGSPDFESTSWNSTIHTYQIGLWNVVYTIVGQNGCSISKSYIIFVGSNPKVSFGTPGNTDICISNSLVFPITETENNPPGTTYTVTFNDGSLPQIFNHPPPSEVTHTFLKSSCGITSKSNATTYQNSFFANIVAVNPCAPSEISVLPIYVSTPPVADFALSANSVCTNSQTCFTNTTFGANEIMGVDCNSAPKVIWSISPATGFSLGNGTVLGDDFESSDPDLWTSGTNKLCPSFSKAGTYTITLKTANRCGTDIKVKTICVESPLIPQFTLNNISGCTPLGVTTTNTTDVSKVCSPPTYSWSVTYASSNCGVSQLYSYTSGTNSSSKDPSFQFTNPGTYTIKLSVTNSCGTKVSSSQTVTVKQPPTVSINDLPSICQTLPATLISPTAAVADCGSVPLTYKWSFPEGITSTSPNPGPISISGSGTKTVTLKVTNECGSTEAVKIFTINDLPTISGDLSACVGFTSQLTGSPPAAVISPWVSSDISVAKVSASGLVTALSSGTTLISYTNNNGCKIARTFTVNALPAISGNLTVGIGYTSQLNGSATAAAVLPWVSSNISVATINNAGLVTAILLGTSTITYTNNDGCQAKVTFTVSSLPTIGGILEACVGSTSKLTGSGTAAASSPWISSNTSIATITNTGLVTAVSEGTVSLTYTNNNGSQVTSDFTVNALPEVAGTLSACINTSSQLSGSGLTASSLPWVSSNTSVATVNNTGLVSAISAGVATITYTNMKGCKIAATFTANALPSISGALSGCVGSTSQLSGSATPVADSPWESSNTTIATVSNTGLVTAMSAGTSTISYTNSIGCIRDVIFTVKPIPIVDQSLNMEVCNGYQTTVVGFSGNISGAVYNWTNSNSSIGLPGFGVGEIKSFTVINAGTSPVMATITVTPTANGCTGSPHDFTITVNPSPIVSFSNGNQIICSGDNTNLVALNSQSVGVEFKWTALEPTGITGVTKTGTNEIPVQTLVNSTYAPIIVNYEATGALNGALACSGSKFIYKITVNPKPIVSASIPAVICSGSAFTVSLLTGNGNIIPLSTTYTWDEPIISPAGALTGGSGFNNPQTVIGQDLTNITSGSGKATYTVTPWSDGCTGEPFNVIVTVNPEPKVNTVGNITHCVGELTTQIDFTGNVPGTVFSWKSSNTSIGIGESGTGNIPSFKTLNTGATPIMSTITVTPSFTSGGISCTGESMNFTVTVYPFLPVSVSITPGANNICPGTNVTYLATPVNGGLNPVWQWKVNGTMVEATEATYTYAPADGDKIECELTSDAICPAGNPAQSNVVTMVVFSSLPAQVSIVGSANNVCPGESVTFTATPFNGGDNPVYQWYVNGVKTGANEPVYTYNPVNGDEVSCQLTSGNSCSESGIVLSNRIRMSVSMPAIIPLFGILQHNECAPIEVTFKNISPTNGNAYIWNFGDGETLTTATPVDVKHKFGNFTAATKVFDVGLKIITSSTHCYIELTKQLTVHPELIAGSPVNYTGCSPFVQKFENAYPGAKSYRWITEKNVLLSTELQPTLTFTAPNRRDTTHIVYLIAESPTGCSDTIMNTIKVSPALEMPSFTYSGSADCRSVTYTFKNTSPEGAELFTWDFDDGTINTTYHANETISHTFLNGTDEPVPFNVTMTSSSGSYCSISVSQQIVVESGYTAGYPVTFQGCSPMIRPFENAFSGSSSYQWRSSTNVLLSEESSPTLTFKALNGRDSTNLVYLIAHSVNGCIDTIVNKIVVRAANKAGFTAVPSEGCAPLTVKFSNTSSSKTNSYEWDFNDGSDFSVIDNPVHLFLESDGSEARYNVSLIAYNQYGCADTAYHEIHLLPTPQVDFIALPNEQIYPSRTVQLNNLTPPGNWTYTWNFGDQKPSVTGLVNSYDYDLPGEYVISLTAKGEQCENTRRIRVAILPGTPLASFEPDTAGCAPLRVNFRNNSQNGSHYTWDFGNGSNSADFSPSITYYNEGVFTVKLSVFNQFGVMSETTRKIVIHPVPKALFKPLPYRVKIPGQTVTFFNYSENANDYLWNFGDGNFSVDVIPVHQYTRTGIFDVALYITSLEGCKDTFLLPAAVDAFSDGLKVPNAFVPNIEGFSGGYYESGDPRNHIFYPAVAVGDLVEYELQIYNRWGNLLFTSQEAERGWDGYCNGRLCPQDVYIWKIRCKFKSGSVVTKTGDVTLLQ